jgi:hypothetical protein
MQEQIKDVQMETPQVQFITKIEVREPVDYNDLKDEVRYLKSQNRKYKQAIKYAGISDLAVLIEEFKTGAINKMRLITAEAMHTDYDREQIQNVQELLGFMDELRVQIQELVSIHEDGKLLRNPSLGPVYKKIDNIFALLSDKPKIQRLNRRCLHELQLTLNDFSDRLDECMQKSGGLTDDAAEL